MGGQVVEFYYDVRWIPRHTMPIAVYLILFITDIMSIRIHCFNAVSRKSHNHELPEHFYYY